MTRKLPKAESSSALPPIFSPESGSIGELDGILKLAKTYGTLCQQLSIGSAEVWTANAMNSILEWDSSLLQAVIMVIMCW